ncbi:polyhomeotic-proximal chromatin protein-like [Neodiprion fabricii]|uniref:polyhomeotic-proximal chromatin protein-like n=1 Tax=Neodiprion fabricii TaxID=2872261 RepID=UPI001ED92B97|nr:polyhomeotic-proximal chromatin protein-like [Neodiprion fabricii]
MKLLKLTAAFLLLVAAIVAAEEEEEGGKAREKRQQIAFYPRRGPRPPPYAVQMEPIVQYSQRDPLYNPLASPKSDDSGYGEEVQPDIGYGYHSDPEPIIEIIIKESNETLPTPVPPPQPQQPRPTKEPIQVFYVKYEKKKGHGDDKPRVVYDAPIPALTPVEEHEELNQERSAYHDQEPQAPLVTSPAPPPEPSTTLRTIIRPDSEVYHAGSSGIRVTFGTEQVPPNQHNKRSDQDQDRPQFSPQIPQPGSPKRQHGPYQPQLQPILHSVQHQQRRFPPALAQQRVVNSFPPPQIISASPPPQQIVYQQPQQLRNPSGRPQRLPITIQGLPEVQQRVPFNSFAFARQNSPSGQQGNGFNVDHRHQQQVFKQQELDKQRYYEQRRQQDLLRQQEQQRQREQQRRQQEIEQKHIQEQQRRQQEIEQKQIQEQQRRQQEIEQKQIQEQHFRQQQQQQQQQIKYNHQQFQQIPQPQFQRQQPVPVPTPAADRPGGEILKSVPKLEQHYAIRENPLHPGPFPPNPQPTQFSEITPQQTQFVPSQQYNSVAESQLQQQQLGQSHRQVPFAGAASESQQQYFSQHLSAPVQHQSSGSSSAGNTQSIWGRPVFSSQSSNLGQKIYATPVTYSGDLTPSTTPTTLSTTAEVYRPSTTATPSTTEAPTTTIDSPKNEAKIKQNIANLPDEVPDHIREQLLSSGILGNADIQILDYDKVGDIPIENLPPEALANFYGAGGGAATSASEPIPAVVKRPKIVQQTEEKVSGYKKELPAKVEQATLRPGGVEMKVVHFDPNTAQGQAIAEQHIRDDATHLDPVKIGPKDTSKYNRYLPLKVSGAAFPLPDVPELNGRRITSVVVLAPVDYNFQGEREPQYGERTGRKFNDVQAVRFLAGDALKQVVKKPTAENYKKWLEQESRADPQRQSVVLLVTTPDDDTQGEKEIFMYDVTTQAVSKLAGDLSTAFVDVAESNSDNEGAQTDIIQDAFA